MAGPTKVTHYQVQKSRRAALLEAWRGYRKTVMRMDGGPAAVDWPEAHRPAWQW